MVTAVQLLPSSVLYSQTPSADVAALAVMATPMRVSLSAVSVGTVKEVGNGVAGWVGGVSSDGDEGWRAKAGASPTAVMVRLRLCGGVTIVIMR